MINLINIAMAALLYFSLCLVIVLIAEEIKQSRDNKRRIKEQRRLDEPVDLTEIRINGHKISY